MKKLVLLMFFFSFQLFAQTTADKQQITFIVKDVLSGFKSKNAEAINQFVNPEYGVGILFKNSGDYGFVLNESIDFSVPLAQIKNYWSIKNEFPIEFNTLPNYDTANNLWLNEGLFVQFNSNIVNEYVTQFLSDYDVNNQPIFELNKNPKNVVYVVLAENNPNAPINGLRFVLTKINQNWNLTFIDTTEYDAQ